MMPAIIAGAVVLAVVVIAVVVMGGKKDKPAPTLPTPAPAAAPTPPPGPPPPVLGPRPNLPSDIVARAKALMPKIKAASDEGKRLSEEAIKAKQANDQDAWQAKNEEAREVFKTARDEWLEIEDQLATYLERNPSKGWDENMLMDAFLKAESREVQRLIDEPLSVLAKTGRGH